MQKRTRKREWKKIDRVKNMAKAKRWFETSVSTLV